jgi:type IVB pilus formation R64 PilN family outer membrane protein
MFKEFSNIKSFRFIYSFLLISCLTAVTACYQTTAINEGVRQAEVEADAALQTLASNTPIATFQVDNRPWYGIQSEALNNYQNLPSTYMASDAITLTFAGPVSLREAANMISAASGIPITIEFSVYNLNADPNDVSFLPSNGREVTGGRVIWTGSLDQILNQIKDIYGIEWVYENQKIRITSETTKTFMLNALANDLTLTGSATSAGSGAASASLPSFSVDGTTNLEIWGEITQAVESIIGDNGQAAFSPSTGAITVTSRPDVLRRVENYLRYQNEMRLRRIAVSVKVLSVLTADTSSYEFDVSGAIQNAIGDYSIGSDGNSDGLSLSIIQDSNVGNNLSAVLEASEGIERVNVVHSGSLVTLSDQPAPLQVGRQIAFLERVSASGDDSGSVSLEPGVIDVGLFMTVLPRIVEDEKILMRLSIAITSADPNFRTFGSGDVQIELPEIDTTGFLQNAVVSNNETMVIAGFEKRQNDLSTTTNPISALLGSSNNTTRSRELLVLVIHSRILPQMPITLVGQ